MKKYLFICFLLTSCGIQVGGGSGSVHNPPPFISYGAPTELKLELSVWGAGHGKIIKRYKNVKCHYRLDQNGKFEAVELIPDATQEQQEAEKKRLTFKCVLPPFHPGQGREVEYYFDMRFDGHYNRRPSEKVRLQ